MPFYNEGYLTYDNLPEDTSVQLLEGKAFENLYRDITYRMVESKEAGVYGLVAGGDFEAEALCLLGIWEDCSEELQDDLMIAVPTKDMVLFTRADDRKSIRKMMKQVQQIFEDKEYVMQEIIENIMGTVNKKKVQSLCKKILKKCSFKSKNDLVNVSDLATWLYIYEYYDEAIAVCDLLLDLEFTGNYSIWWHADYTACLKARILREKNIIDSRKELLERVNGHRHPELYINGVDWYRITVNKNIQSDDDYSPNRINDGWRMEKLKHAIMYREAGGHPISDEEFEADIREIVDLLKQVK